MAKFTYTSNEGAILKFDSDPYRSLAMRYGYSKGSVRLVNVDSNERHDIYEVHAVKGGSTTETLVGKLESLSNRELWRNQR